MHYLILAASLTFTMLLSACSSVPTKDIRVDASADPKASLTGYKTYAWFAAAQIVFDPEGQWEPRDVDIDAEVQAIINRELRMRAKVEDEVDPDMLVAYAAGVDMASLGLKEDPETQESLLANVPKAALVVALIDANTGYVFWLGEAVGEVQQQVDAATVRARLKFAIGEMFRLLPKN